MADAVAPGVVDALNLVDQAHGKQLLTDGAALNIKVWLTEDRYSDYRQAVIDLLQASKWKELDDAFWTVIPFGTGGRRGRMYPVGCNVINDRTIGESAQGLADYVKEAQAGDGKPLACAIAYDTRHRSRHFAELCAEVMVAAGFQVFFLNGYRSTPALSFTVRYKNCSCGIMVTASHNPPSDNAVKAYWSTGGQILPPHDTAVIDRVMTVQDIRRVPFAQALAEGKVKYCEAEVDAAFTAALKAQAFPGPRDVGILYSPLHGVGGSAVVPALQADGFTRLEVFAHHAEPNGDFPNVPGHVSNPENPKVFDAIIAQAQKDGMDLILATDPDCDRLGVASPVKKDTSGPWATFTGNQIGALLVEYVLAKRKAAGSLSKDHFVVKTLVTTEMIRRIADAYGVKTYGDLQVGFKWIGGTMDQYGPDRFVFGCEESHGYLVGQYARDKDGAVAAMLMAELAAQVKAEGKTLVEKMDALYWQYGYHLEKTISLTMPGSEGMSRMAELMTKLRTAPPKSLAGMKVSNVRDFKNLKQFAPGGTPVAFDGPKGDMVMIDLLDETGEPGNYVAVRPSGTEPKVKFYAFAYVPAEQLSLLDQTKAETELRIVQLERDLAAFAGAK